MIRTLLTLAAVLGTASSLRAQEEVCVPKFAGTTAPALTATVNDTNWAGALRFNLKETRVGTNPDWAAVARAGWQRGVSAAVDGLYLSLVVKQGMIALGDDVRIILGVRTTGAEDWVLHIDPFSTTLPMSGGGSEAPHSVQHWRYNGGWNLGPTAGATDWQLASRVAVDNPTWSFTLRIPFSSVPAGIYPAGVAFPADDKFSFYLAIVPATTLSSTTNQITWPQGLNMPDAVGVPAANTPDAGSWSSAGLLPGDDVFIPGIGGLAGVPVIDGKVEGDAGWNQALRVNLAKDLGVSRSAVLQAGRAGNFLYLGVVVKADSAPDAADTLLLCISPQTGGATHDWRFHIRPFSGVPPTGASAVPAQALFWRNSATWNNLPSLAGTDALAGLLSGNISTTYDGTEWSVEMKIPLSTNAADVGLNTAVYLPTATPFKLQLDVLATSAVTTTVTQMAWPLCAEVMPYSTDADTNLLENNTPSPAHWGVASFYDRPACHGISLAWDRIGVRDPVSGTSIVSDIRRYGPIAETNLAAAQALSNTHLWPATNGGRNLFVAEPYNGTSTPARVQATFRIADWGLPVAEQWTPIKHDTGVTQTTPMEAFENPTPATLSTATNVPATSFGTLEMNWYLSYRESAVRKFLNPSNPNRSHQCIQVDLDSPDTSVRFKNKSVQRNMDFVGASVFKADAKVSAKGRGPLTAGRPQHQILLAVATKVRPHGGTPSPETEQRRQPRKVVLEDRKEHVLPPEEGEPDELVKYPEAVKETFTWIARGYRLTGRSIRIHTADYEVADFLGGFGVVAGHEGPVESWIHEVEGASSRKKAHGLYVLDVPHGEHVSLTLRLEALEKSKPRIWLFVFLALLALLLLFVLWRILKR